jgi:hypothetical protein
MGKLQGLNSKDPARPSTATPMLNRKQFMGLAPRFNTLSTSKAASAENVFSAGGTGLPTPLSGLCHGVRTLLT